MRLVSKQHTTRAALRRGMEQLQNTLTNNSYHTKQAVLGKRRDILKKSDLQSNIYWLVPKLCYEKCQCEDVWVKLS